MRWIALLLSVYSAFANAADIRVIGSSAFQSSYQNAISFLPQNFVANVPGVIEVREDSQTSSEDVTPAIIHQLIHFKDEAEKISSRSEYQALLGVKKDVKEALAVDATLFFTDAEFECRRPATAKFLAKTFNVSLKKSCERNFNVVLQSSYFQDNYSAAASINPRRIYQIHYLFAGKGQEIMSRFGHAMFRLVVCAPYRKESGPECLQDVSHHIALSYRANVTDFTLSKTKGLSGKYPSQLFIMRYLEVLQDYTKFELRDLYSIPLKLNSSQISDFIDVTIERYWTYQGKYYFVNNNCGTEAKKQLSIVLDEKNSSQINSLTPHSIYEDVINDEHDLADGNFKELSRDEMIRKHFLMESMYKALNETYLSLRPYMSSFKSINLKAFLKTTTAKARLADYQQLQGKIAGVSGKKDLLLKLNLLERYLASSFTRSLPRIVMQKIDKDPALKNEVMKMGKGSELFLEGPWQIVRARYGSPLKEEFDDQYGNFLAKRREQLSGQNEQLENIQKLLGKKELEEVQNLQQIKSFVAKLINSLIL